MTRAVDFTWVTPALATWGAFEPAVKCDLNSTGIVTAEGLVLVDPVGLGTMHSLIAAARPAAILLTSGNHARAALTLRAQLGVPVHAPLGIAAELGFEPDFTVAPGAAGPGGLLAIPLHSAGPGELAYWKDGVLIVGDALIHLPQTGFALLPEKYRSAARELPNDLRKLLSHDFHTLTFAHGPPITSGARQRLVSLLE